MRPTDELLVTTSDLGTGKFGLMRTKPLLAALIGSRFHQSILLPVLVLSLCCFSVFIFAQEQGSIKGRVCVIDPNGVRSYIPGAAIQLRSQTDVRTTVSDNVGNFSFDLLPPAVYSLTAKAPGMRLNEQSIEIHAGVPAIIELRMEVAELAEEVSVSADAPLIQTTNASSASELTDSALKNAPNVNERFETALPLVPGVVRGPDGLINMKGNRTSQGGMLVNSASVSDPVTGSTGFSLPIDVVSSIQVIANPYDAEYGKISGTVAAVETKLSAADKFHFTLNNIMPRMRKRDGSIVGIEAATPRFTVTGPLKRNRIAITQSFEYRFVRTPVYTLPPLQRDMELESLDSFTQIDLNLSERQSATVSVSIYPQKMNYLGLNTFTPQPATPDFRQRGYLMTMQHRYTPGSTSLLVSQVSVKRYDADIRAHGDDLYRIGVETKAGGFFNRQNRQTTRVELQETYHFIPPSLVGGSHTSKIGINLVHNSYDGRYVMMPVEILRASGLPAERLDFGPPAKVSIHQNEATAFYSDKWTIHSQITLDLGLRLDHDSLTGSSQFSPRLGFALVPTKGSRTVLRGGIGVFYDKVNLNAKAFESYPDRTVTSFDAEGLLTGKVRYVQMMAGRLRNPRSVAWNGEVERELAGNLALRIGYQQRETTRDFLVNPTVFSGMNCLLLSNSGRSRYREVQVTARYRVKRHEINASYVRSAADGDLNDLNQFFGNTPQPIVRANERSRLSFDVPNRVLLWGQFEAPFKITFSPVFDWHTGFPYSVVNESLEYVEPRNRAGRFPAFSSVDLQVTKEVKIPVKKDVRARVGVRIFNLFNHYNPRDLQNNLGSARLGTFFNSVDRMLRGKFVLEF